jgi:hypothetical protein
VPPGRCPTTGGIITTPGNCLTSPGVQGTAAETKVQPEKANTSATLRFCFMPGSFNFWHPKKLLYLPTKAFLSMLTILCSFFSVFSFLLFFSSCSAVFSCFVFSVVHRIPCLILQPQATKKKKDAEVSGSKGSGCLGRKGKDRKAKELNAENEKKELVFKVNHHQEEESRKGEDRSWCFKVKHHQEE